MPRSPAAVNQYDVAGVMCHEYRSSAYRHPVHFLEQVRYPETLVVCGLEHPDFTERQLQAAILLAMVREKSSDNSWVEFGDADSVWENAWTYVNKAKFEILESKAAQIAEHVFSTALSEDEGFERAAARKPASQHGGPVT